jgi:hypothetical protein
LRVALYTSCTTQRRRNRFTAGSETIWKLTQKIRSDPRDPAIVSITNTYLSREEYELLASLYPRALAGLRLAVVEVTDLAEPLPRAAWLGREVTHDDRYSGGRLSRTLCRRAGRTACERQIAGAREWGASRLRLLEVTHKCCISSFVRHRDLLRR